MCLPSPSGKETENTESKALIQVHKAGQGETRIFQEFESFTPTSLNEAGVVAGGEMLLLKSVLTQSSGM